MRVCDHIVAAEYANAAHTELVYITAAEGRHRIKKDENPSFWNHVLQRAVMRTYDPQSHIHTQVPPPQPPSIVARATPHIIDVPVRRDSAPTHDVTAEWTTKLAAKDAEIAELTMALKFAYDYAESEAVAEYAILAMAPDGVVDPAKKSEATAALSREAAARGISLEDLCSELGRGRAERNRKIVEERLRRLGA